MLAAVREGTAERGEHVDATIGLLLKDGIATELHLEPFGRDDLSALATQVLGPEVTQAALADWLYERTRGNALFATAVLEDLAQDPDRREAPRSLRDIGSSMRR